MAFWARHIGVFNILAANFPSRTASWNLASSLRLLMNGKSILNAFNCALLLTHIASFPLFVCIENCTKLYQCRNIRWRSRGPLRQEFKFRSNAPSPLEIFGFDVSFKWKRVNLICNSLQLHAVHANSRFQKLNRLNIIQSAISMLNVFTGRSARTLLDEYKKIF